jgi:hypothetical protein
MGLLGVSHGIPYSQDLFPGGSGPGAFHPQVKYPPPVAWRRKGAVQKIRLLGKFILQFLDQHLGRDILLQDSAFGQ